MERHGTIYPSICLLKKMKAKEKAKGKKKKDGGGDNDKEADKEDPYTALSRSTWSGAASAKPPVGNFETCAKCEKEFTVVRDCEMAICH